MYMFVSIPPPVLLFLCSLQQTLSARYLPSSFSQANDMMEKLVGNNPMLLVKAARRGIEFWKVGVAALEVAGQHLLEKVQQPRDGKRLM